MAEKTLAEMSNNELHRKISALNAQKDKIDYQIAEIREVLALRYALRQGEKPNS